MAGEGMNLLPTTTGFLTRDNNRYIMHDWHDGHRRWQVTLVGETRWGQPHSAWSEADNSSFALSDNGRYFTTSVVQKHGVRVQRWFDGKPDGDCVVLSSRINPPQPGFYQLAIGNHGRILLQYYFEKHATPPDYLLVMDGRRIIARATLPARACILPGGAMAFDSYTNILYAIHMKANLIHFTRIAHIGPNYLQFPGNYILTENGAIYTPVGRALPPNPRHKISEHNRLRASYGLPTDWLVFSNNKEQHDIFSLSTHACWSLKCNAEQEGITVSANGRYVLMFKHDFFNSDKSEKQTNSFGYEKDAIWLYERPGILRAALCYNNSKFELPEGGRVFAESCYDWILSPDGRSVILKYQYMSIGGTAMLYHW